MTIDSSMPASEISIQSVSKTYQTERGEQLLALSDVNLEVEKGEFVALLGPSGCGKSTLLRTLAGLERHSSGSVRISGQTITGPHESVGLVFQTSVLLPWRTILQNVLIPVQINDRVTDEWVTKARTLLAKTGLQDFANHYPRELSGGMRQRAAICRTILMDPPVLLMDEPFGALDAMTRDTMNEELLNLWRETGKTVVFVTHDIAEAARLASRIVVMSPRPGRIAAVIGTEFDRDLPYEERVTSSHALELANKLRDMFRVNPNH